MVKEPEGATPASITNHPFVPEGEWWSQCESCGLSEAAHFTTTLCPSCGGAGVMPGRDRDGNYDRCDPCEGTGLAAETDLAPWKCGTPAALDAYRRGLRERGEA